MEHDLACRAALEQVERALELLEAELGGDERPEIDDAVLEQPPSPIPGVPDLATAYCRYLEVLEDERLRDVELDRLGRNPEENDTSAVADDLEGL